MKALLSTQLRKAQAEHKTAAAAEATPAAAAPSDASAAGSTATGSTPPPTTATAPAAPAAAAKSCPAPTPSGERFVEIKTFGWDQGAYDSNTVSVYVSEGMDGVGALPKGAVTCDFTPHGFDLRVEGLVPKSGGAPRSYRLLKDNLDKEIVPDQSKVSIRSSRLTIKLRKKKGEYSYEHWTDLTSKKTAKEVAGAAAKGADPMGGIMDMMKDMYDKGDDTMKKTIGEAMMKSRGGGAAGLEGDDLGM